MTYFFPTAHLARTLSVALAWGLIAELAAAQPVAPGPAGSSLAVFLAALDGSPELLAAQVTVEAAELQLRAAYDPVALSATGGYTRIDLDDSLTGVPLRGAQAPTDPTDPGAGGDVGAGTLSETGYNVSTTLTFRPYPFGDVADLVAQRELDLENSLLERDNARAALEARGLEAALQARLAERSAELAREGVAAAAQGLTATRLRAAKGAANARDLRNAEAALFEAQTILQNAQLDVKTARLNLQSLVGDTPPPSALALTSLRAPPQRTPVSVSQALVQARLTDLSISAAQRELLPVASASYAWNVSDYSTLTASVESRTLQPSVGFAYQEPGRTLPTSAVEGSFQVGISANISVGALDVLSAAERQGAAVQAGVSAAREGGALQEAALRSAATQAARNAELNRRSFADARVTYQENTTRQDLGLTSPLETRTTLLELSQADLERSSSELSALGALLDLYELYALPPSETLR